MSWRRAAGGTVASPAHRVRHPPKRRAHTHLACGCWLCHRRVGSARCTALGTARVPDRSGLCRTARHRCVGLRSSSRHYPFIGIRARRRGRRSIRAVPSRSPPRDSRPNRRHPRRRAALAQLSRCALDLLVWHRFSSAVLDAAISVSVDSARVCERARRPADPGSASPLPASRHPSVVGAQSASSRACLGSFSRDTGCPPGTSELQFQAMASLNGWRESATPRSSRCSAPLRALISSS